MAIDLDEKLMLLAEVPAYLAKRGIRKSVRQVQQWVADGLLETTPPALGRRYTSEEAVDRAFAGGDAKVRGRKPPRKDRKNRTRRNRERGHAAAMKRLKEEGIA